MPEVSLILPVFNTGPYLRECLDSAVGQTLRDLEILCVDDGSTDGSPEILQEYAGRFTNISVITHPENRSLLQARKSGALRASGEYVMFLDSDDTLAPDACEKAYAAIREAGADVLQFGVRVVGHGLVTDAGADSFQKWINVMPDGPLTGGLLDACFVSHLFQWNLVNKILSARVCKAAYRRLGDGYHNLSEDLLTMFFVLEEARKYACIPDALYTYHRGRGMTASGRPTPERLRRACEENAAVCGALRSASSFNGGTERSKAIRAISAYFFSTGLRACRRMPESDRESCLSALYETWDDDPAVFGDLFLEKKQLAADTVRDLSRRSMALRAAATGAQSALADAQRERDAAAARLGEETAKNAALTSSVSFRLGRALTFLPRKARDLWRALKG